MKITIKREQGSLNESGQGRTVIKFATIDENGNTTSPFFQCRDYIGDLLWSHYTGNDISVYGFHATAVEYEDIMKDSRFRMVYKITEGGKGIPITPEQFEGVEAAVKQFNEALAFPPCMIGLCEEGEHIIVDVDKAWTEVPYLQSALVLICRMGFKYIPSKPFLEYFDDGSTGKFTSPYDGNYFRHSKHILKKLLKGEVDTSQKYNPIDDKYTVHEGYGISQYGITHKN